MKLNYLFWAAAILLAGESVPVTAARSAAPLHSAPQPPPGVPTRGAEFMKRSVAPAIRWMPIESDPSIAISSDGRRGALLISTTQMP